MGWAKRDDAVTQAREREGGITRTASRGREDATTPRGLREGESDKTLESSQLELRRPAAWDSSVNERRPFASPRLL